ncbi:MAG: hypothetical protein HW397_345 [Dehalococcoidia bacterium]|nr:hypothetical protein [Dehalococcoidia bacterium]
MLRPFNPADVVSLFIWQAKSQHMVACGRHSMAAGKGEAVPWVVEGRATHGSFRGGVCLSGW